MITLVFVFILAFLQCVNGIELTNDGLNRLTRENLDYVLSQNYTILALWNSQNCPSCAKTMWDVYKAVYSFLPEKTFFVMATNIGFDESLDLQYEIDPNEGGTQYRLFLSGSTEPISRKEEDAFNVDDLITWISKETHFVPQEDCVIDVTPDTFDSFFNKNSYRSIMIHYYLPHYQPSQLAVVQYQRAALAFKIEAKVVFARLDCTGYAEFCTDKGVGEMPAFLFYPKKGVSFDGKQITSKRGEGIVMYLNEILGTQVDSRGGFNEQFGRNYELDQLARRFIENNNVNQQKRIIKETAKLRHRYHSTAKYYKIMKNYMKEGPSAIMKELSLIRSEMKKVKVDDIQYPKLRARENIIHQFEVIHTKNEHVHLNPWSWDYVVNGFNNVLVLFYTSWCKECVSLQKEFEEHAKTNMEDVVVASMDAQLYVDFCSSFHISHFPTILFFKADRSLKEFEEVNASNWGGVQSFINKNIGEEKEL